jgi:hypothetical protein
MRGLLAIKEMPFYMGAFKKQTLDCNGERAGYGIARRAASEIEMVKGF